MAIPCGGGKHLTVSAPFNHTRRMLCAVLSRLVVSHSSRPHSRQECWSQLPCPLAGDLPNPGIKARPPTLQVDSLPSEPPGKPKNTGVGSQKKKKKKKPCWLNGSFSNDITNHSLGRTHRIHLNSSLPPPPASTLSYEHVSPHHTLEQQQRPRGALEPPSLHGLPPCSLPPPPAHTHRHPPELLA